MVNDDKHKTKISLVSHYLIDDAADDADDDDDDDNDGALWRRW